MKFHMPPEAGAAFLKMLTAHVTAVHLTQVGVHQSLMVLYKAGLWIRIHLNPDPDPDPAFFVNQDLDSNQIMIQTESGSESRTGFKPDPD
jgi:hypothetical protein